MSAIILQPGRIWLLMRKDLWVARTPAVLIAAASGATFVVYVLTSIGGGSPTFHLIAYPILLVLFGYILSSFSFQDIHDRQAGVYELTRPGSILEKYVARVLLTSVGWAVVVTLAYMATTLIGAVVAGVIFGESDGVFAPNSGVIWEIIARYLVSQSIFVFGSIYFKKSALLKTVLVSVVLVVIYAIFFLVVLRAVNWNAFAQIIPTEAEMDSVVAGMTAAGTQIAAALERVLDFFGWIAVPIFFWIVGYVRLRETEV